MLLGLAVVEAALRIARMAVDPVTQGLPLQKDEILHHVWMPNANVAQAGNGITYVVKTNAQGWAADHDVRKAKPAGTYRIFYVGDSNTHGIVPLEQRMVEIVSKILRKIGKESRIDFEVINTGVSSFSILNYYLLVKTRLIEYSPDLIIINIDMNDVGCDALYRLQTKYDANGRPTAIMPAGPDTGTRYLFTPTGVVDRGEEHPIYMWFVRHCAIAYFIDPYILKLRLSNERTTALGVVIKIDDDQTWISRNWNDNVEKNVAYSMTILGYCLDELRERGIKVVITGVPHLPQYTGEWSALPHLVLQRTAESHGALYIDTFGRIAERCPRNQLAELYFKSDTTHFNQRGNALWAEIQLDFLLDPANRLMPESVYKAPR